MARSAVLKIDIIADASKAAAGLDTVDGKMGKLGGNARKMGLLVGAAAGAMALKFGTDSVKAFTEAEEAQKRLGFALEKFPALADTNIERLGKLNSALAKKTKFDDDNIASGQAVLANFKLTGKQLEETTPLLLDYASMTGKDIPGAAQDVGKALLGNAKALKNIGISYKATGDKTKDYANITALMREKVGGFADKEGKTAAGQAAILKNQFGEIQEEVGSKLVPILAKLATALLEVIDFVSRNSKVIIPLVAVLGTLAAIVYTITAATKVWTAIQAAFNVVMMLNPVGLVVLAIVALIAIVVLAYKHSDTFREKVDAAFTAIVAAGVWLKDQLGEKLEAIVGFFTSLPGRITTAAGDLFGAIKEKAEALRAWHDAKIDAIVSFFTGLPGRIARGAGDLFAHVKEKAEALRSYIDGKIDAVVGFVTGLPGRIAAGAGDVFSFLKEKAEALRSYIDGKVDSVVGYFTGIPGRLSGAFAGAFDGLSGAFKSAINFIIRKWNNLKFSIPGFDPPGPGPKFGGITINFPNLAELAARPPVGMVAPRFAGIGDLARPTLGLAQSAWSTASSSSGWFGAGMTDAGGVVVDSRTIDARVFVDGDVIDTPGFLSRLERAQADQAVRLGQVTAFRK